MAREFSRGFQAPTEELLRGWWFVHGHWDLPSGGRKNLVAVSGQLPGRLRAGSRLCPTFRAYRRRPARRCWSSENLTWRLARRWAIPVNPTGLADRLATQKVDGGSAGATADGCRARSR